MSAWFIVAALCGTAATGCGAAVEDETVDEEAIVGGKREAGFRAVGYLSMDDDTSGQRFSRFCTATLIAPNVVATAAHCVHEMKFAQQPGGPWMTFAVGSATPIARRPTRVYSVYEDPAYNPLDPEYQTNNGAKHDFALLVLASNVTDVTPARIGAPDASRKHIAIGYGRTVAGAFDLVERGLPQRKAIPMTVGAISATFTNAEPTNKRTDSVCYGDSGGALLEIDPQRPTEALLVGVLAQMDNDDPSRTCLPGTGAGYSSLAAHRSLVAQATQSR